MQTESTVGKLLDTYAVIERYACCTKKKKGLHSFRSHTTYNTRVHNSIIERRAFYWQGYEEIEIENKREEDRDRQTEVKRKR